METVRSREVYANSWMRAKPDYALVIQLDGDRLHLVEQFRYPVGARRWKFPQGTAPGCAEIDPAELAAPELHEETGLHAGRMELLGLLDVAPGQLSQRGRVFLATELTAGSPEREHEEQDMRTASFPRAEFEPMATCRDRSQPVGPQLVEHRSGGRPRRLDRFGQHTWSTSGYQPVVLDQPLAHLITGGRDEYRHRCASFGDLDRLTRLDPVQVAAGVLAQLPDSDAFHAGIVAPVVLQRPSTSANRFACAPSMEVATSPGWISTTTLRCST